MKPLASSSLNSVARLGVVHHLLYLDTMANPAAHARTLRELIERPDIETLDCCLPAEGWQRTELIQAIRRSGKTNLCVAPFHFPIRKLSFASVTEAEQRQVRSLLAESLRDAAEMGAMYFLVGSGGPPAGEARPEHSRALRDFFGWLCAELKPAGITVLLEPFDVEMDKCFMLGPTLKCAEFVAAVAAEYDNVGIELDFAHLPLLREDFASAIHAVRPWLKRVHVGNCLIKNREDRFYGDNHPPIGYPDGEIDTPQVAEILRLLHEVGYLNETNRGDVILEIQPFPGKSVEASLADNFARLETAWELSGKAAPPLPTR